MDTNAAASSLTPTENPRTPRRGRKPRKAPNGTGTIYQRKDGLWVGALMVGRKTDGHPAMRTVSAKTQAEAQDRLDKLRDKVKGGFQTPGSAPDRATVEAFLDRWLEGIKGSVRQSTWNRYDEVCTHALKPRLGRIRLSALRADHVQQLYADLRKDGKAPRTVLKAHAVLHRALGRALNQGLVARNVTDQVDKPKPPKGELTPPTAEEVRHLLETAEESEDRLAPLWIVAVYSGCRLGELLALQWPDIDFEQGTISIRRSLERVDGTVPVYGDPKTARSRRTVALPKAAIQALSGQKAEQNQERLALGKNYAPYKLVFSSEIGTPLPARNVSRRFKMLLKVANLPKTTRIHDLRHFAATLMLAAGVHPKVASERLGHSTVGITLDLYSHVVQGLDVDAAERMERAMQERPS